MSTGPVPMLDVVMGVLAGQRLRFTARVLPVLLCPLVAHAVAYRSITPRDGLHGYLGVYELVVFGLSAAAVAVLTVATAAAVTGRGARWRTWLTPSTDYSLARRATSLAAPALLVLVLQAALERSLASGASERPGSILSAWLLALAALLAAAFVLTLVARSCGRLLDAVLAPRRGGAAARVRSLHRTIPRALGAGTPSPSVARSARLPPSPADSRRRRAPVGRRLEVACSMTEHC